LGNLQIVYLARVEFLHRKYTPPPPLLPVPLVPASGLSWMMIKANTLPQIWTSQLLRQAGGKKVHITFTGAISSSKKIQCTALQKFRINFANISQISVVAIFNFLISKYNLLIINKK
jgi:hypothetical protein